MKEKLRNKKVIAGIVSVMIVLLLGIIITAIAISNNNPLKIEKKEVVVEYGSPISTEAKDYLSSTVKTDIVSQTEIKINGELEKDKKYYPVGEYKVSLEYKGKETVVNVKVTDTTKPELTVPKEVEIQKGTELDKYDFKSLFEAKDLSEVSEYNIDTSKVDATKVGEYEVTVSIEDKWKNKNEKSFKVNIVEVIANENEEIKTEVVTQEDGTKKVTVKKETKPNSNNVVSSTSPSQTTGGSTTTKPSTGNSSSSTKPSGSGSSSSNTGSTTKPSGDTGSTTKPSGNNNSGSTTKPEEKPHTHMFTDKVDKWFKTQNECIDYFDQVSTYWEKKEENGEISFEEYCKKCPFGYEVIRCTCGMRGIILSYC